MYNKRTWNVIRSPTSLSQRKKFPAINQELKGTLSTVSIQNAKLKNCYGFELLFSSFFKEISASFPCISLGAQQELKTVVTVVSGHAVFICSSM